MAGTSNTMLNKSGESGHRCLSPDFSVKDLSFSLLSIVLAVGLSKMAFIILSYIPSLPILVRFFFIINGYWILSNAFSAAVEMIMWFLTFLFLMCCMMLIDLCMLSHPCELGMTPTCLWCMIFFIFCCICLVG